MKNTYLKYCLGLTILVLCTKTNAQVTPPTGVKLTLGANNADVEGNVKATGLIEGNALKSRGLATGNPFVANPVYANVDGDLVTGYKVGYLSIPPVAFRLNLHLYSDNTSYYQSDDFVVYTGSYMGFYSESTDKYLLAPLNFQHKSKLSTLKFTFYSFNPKFIQGSIIRTSLTSPQNESTIFTFNTPVANGTTVTAEFPIDLIEIDNQNYVYTLQLKTSTNNWGITSIIGASIEYRDM